MEFDLSGTIETLHAHVNPEVWHYQRGTHPGLGWHIKSVLPNGTYHPAAENLYDQWHRMAHRNPAAVRITPTALDWNGSVIQGFSTIWLADANDVAHTNWQGLLLINHSNGLVQARARLLGLIDAQRSILDQERLLLVRIVQMLGSKQNSVDTKLSAKGLKVIDGGLCSQTDR